MTDKSKNELLRDLIMDVVRKAGEPVSIQYISEKVYGLGFKAGDHLTFKVGTNLGVLRTAGHLRKGSFPTGNYIDYGYRKAPETKTFWYLSTMKIAEVVAAKRKFRALWQKEHPNLTINAGPGASE